MFKVFGGTVTHDDKDNTDRKAHGDLDPQSGRKTLTENALHILWPLTVNQCARAEDRPDCLHDGALSTGEWLAGTVGCVFHYPSALNIEEAPVSTTASSISIYRIQENTVSQFFRWIWSNRKTRAEALDRIQLEVWWAACQPWGLNKNFREKFYFTLRYVFSDIPRQDSDENLRVVHEGKEEQESIPEMSSDIIAAFDILHVSILLNHLEKYVGLSAKIPFYVVYLFKATSNLPSVNYEQNHHYPPSAL
ncbi:hypothetical protein E5288_WYG001191 [Bos mutus]|uniref:Uncharacterized protein n=1 Tax=Bos mutus TaxID=72004 RepID=A0A6B0S4R0_9CETA|nr:hypothetical protein [Bos mutus]